MIKLIKKWFTHTCRYYSTRKMDQRLVTVLGINGGVIGYRVMRQEILQCKCGKTKLDEFY